MAILIHDYEEKGLSYRTLGKKYGIGFSTARRIVMANQKKRDEPKQAGQSADLPDDTGLLKEELRKARLKIELQDLMIDIAGKELGVDIRKKSGTRQSR